MLTCFIVYSQRGDGFPLAHMLALVIAENKDLAPVMQAHVFTVCPTAVPNLPTPAPDASEDDLMKSLGMLKTKDGEYETFDRFLSRTEVCRRVIYFLLASLPLPNILFFLLIRGLFRSWQTSCLRSLLTTRCLKALVAR
jgi:hypothetical protein